LSIGKAGLYRIQSADPFGGRFLIKDMQALCWRRQNIERRFQKAASVISGRSRSLLCRKVGLPQKKKPLKKDAMPNAPATRRRREARALKAKFSEVSEWNYDGSR
jgi:hypothetical protein